MNIHTDIDAETAARLRIHLLELARHHDDLAADIAAATPYWLPQPAAAEGHRRAAGALVADADLLLPRAS
ncbi:hypothetical protein GCM10028801_16830 [Nocardioides maradonensis]